MVCHSWLLVGWEGGWEGGSIDWEGVKCLGEGSFVVSKLWGVIVSL